MAPGSMQIKIADLPEVSSVIEAAIAVTEEWRTIKSDPRKSTCSFDTKNLDALDFALTLLANRGKPVIPIPLIRRPK